MAKTEKLNIPEDKRIEDHHLDVIAKAQYYEYAVAVNEDRAIPSAIDGLKPVSRRGLWSCFKLGAMSNSKPLKSARVTGHCMGLFHPHGGAAIYGALVTMRNSPMSLIEGIGTWGSLSDTNVAAERYTEMRMSAYAERIFFDKFYMPTLTYVSNYDGSTVEPLCLPALLPNLLLNGTSGIGVGARTEIPAYTLESVIALLRESFKGKAVDHEMCSNLLEFTTLYKGVPVLNKEARKEIKTFYKTGKGGLLYKSTYTVNPQERLVRIEKFAPFSDLKKQIGRVAEHEPSVQRINDDSDIKDRYANVSIVFKKGIAGEKLEKEARRIVDKYFSAKENYDIKITTRLLDEKGEASAKLSSSTIPKIIEEWKDYRIKLEKTACTYWIKERAAEIAYLNLMILAVKNRSLIIKALDMPFDDKELAEYLAKMLKITVAQADQILDLKVRQLKSLENSKLKDKIKKLQSELDSYQARFDKPSKYILSHLDELFKELYPLTQVPASKKKKK